MPPSCAFFITDKEGQKVNEIKGPKNAGIGRVNWDLRYGAPDIPELGRTRRGRGPCLNELPIANEIPHVFPVKIIKFNQ